ncbi:MFS transporter [Frondihabitans sucicola]|uniref:MFS transporter n=1 Tax=Frondihabitans sucicola TaxID=1268041 RepID=A0ABM8GHI7_9MICO|nr:MFS transporter [Frondihabitans sucicola]BDZ47818.1 MFS transporter [Frondihabitans sucicola]
MTRAEVIDGSGEWLGHERGSVRYRLLLASLFCVGVATFAQLYSPQAVLASIGRGFGVTASSSALVISASTVGLAIGVLPWAAASDRWGRLRVMSIAVLGATILGLLVPWSPSFPLLLTGRFFEGLMIGGAPAVALAYLGEEVHAKDTARAAGTYVAGTTVGGLAGRIIAGSVANVAGWRLGVFVVALVCGAAAIAFVRLAPRPRRFVRADRGDRAARVSARLGQNLRSPRQLVLYAQGFLLMGGFVALYNFFGFRLTAAPLSVPPAVAEFAFVAYLAGTVTSSRAGALASRFGERRVLLASGLVMLGGVALTVTTELVPVVIGLILATGGFFGAHAVASGWAARDAGGARAQASGLYNLCYYAGSSAFGWLGGLAFDAGGWTGTAVTVIGLVVVALAAAAVGLPRRVVPAVG